MHTQTEIPSVIDKLCCYIAIYLSNDATFVSHGHSGIISTSPPNVVGLAIVQKI